jgi:transposase
MEKLAKWKIIKKIVPNNGRKRKYDLRNVFNTIFYMLKSGCQWLMLPSSFPKWQLVYYFYGKWVSMELFDLLLQKLRLKVRVKLQQNSNASLE